MPYVVRDKSGQICEVHNAPDDRAREELDARDPNLQQFLSEAGGQEVQGALGETDIGLVRVLEDLIGTLIDKRIIALTDLPEAAQKKLAHRYSLRSRLADLQGIVGDQDEILLP